MEGTILVKARGFAEVQSEIGRVRDKFNKKHIFSTPIDFLRKNFNGTEEEFNQFLDVAQIPLEDRAYVGKTKDEQFAQNGRIIRKLWELIKNKVHEFDKFDAFFVSIALKKGLLSTTRDKDTKELSPKRKANNLVTYELEYDLSMLNIDQFKQVTDSIQNELDLSSNLYSYINFEPIKNKKIQFFTSQNKYYNLGEYFNGKMYDNLHLYTTDKHYSIVAPGKALADGSIEPYKQGSKAAANSINFNIVAIDINRFLFTKIEEITNNKMLLVGTQEGVAPGIKSQQFLQEPTPHDIQIIKSYMLSNVISNKQTNNQRGSNPANESLNIAFDNDKQIEDAREINKIAQDIKKDLPKEPETKSIINDAVLDFISTKDNKDRLNSYLSQLKSNKSTIVDLAKNGDKEGIAHQINSYNQYVTAEQFKQTGIELEELDSNFVSLELKDMKKILDDTITQIANVLKTEKKEVRKTETEFVQAEEIKPNIDTKAKQDVVNDVKTTTEQPLINRVIEDENNHVTSHIEATAILMQKQINEAKVNYPQYIDVFLEDIMEHNSTIERAMNSIHAASRNKYQADFVLQAVLMDIQNNKNKDNLLLELEAKLTEQYEVVKIKENEIDQLQTKLSEAINERDAVKDTFEEEVLQMKETFEKKLSLLQSNYAKKEELYKETINKLEVENKYLQKNGVNNADNAKYEFIDETHKQERTSLLNTIESSREIINMQREQIKNLLDQLKNNTTNTYTKPEVEEEKNKVIKIVEPVKPKQEPKPVIKTIPKEVVKLEDIDARLKLADYGMLSKGQVKGTNQFDSLVKIGMIGDDGENYTLDIYDDVAADLLSNESLDFEDIKDNFKPVDTTIAEAEAFFEQQNG
jgi:hypothetical protein